VKVIKSYSLDLDVVQMIEAQHTDAYGEIGSRSKTVNDAIRWYLNGNLAEQIASHEQLMANFRDVCIENDRLKTRMGLTPPPKATKSWWRSLLGLSSRT
jgi:hypothetical protein